MTKATETRFLDLVAEALRVTQDRTWLDHIIDNHYLVAFDKAPGLFLVAHRQASPRELAVMLAVKQVEHDAYQSFLAGAQAASERSQLSREQLQ